MRKTGWTNPSLGSGSSNFSSGSPHPSQSSRRSRGRPSPRFTTTSVHGRNVIAKSLNIDEFGSMESDNEEDITNPGSIVDTCVGRVPTNESVLNIFGLPSNKGFVHPGGSESRSSDLTNKSSRDKKFTYSLASEEFPKDPQLSMQSFPESFKNQLNSTPMNRYAEQTTSSSSAALNSSFGANIVPSIPVYAPHQDFLSNTNVKFPNNAYIPQELSYVQNMHMALPGHLMASSEQGFIQNTNMGPSANTGYWPQPTHKYVQITTISPSVDEAPMNRVPDGTGSLEYPAPDPDLLTFDPKIGYRYDAKTGLHYDANSGYFINRKLRIFLQWDFYTKTYLRVENPLIPFPVFKNHKDSSESDRSRKRRASRSRSVSPVHSSRKKDDRHRSPDYDRRRRMLRSPKRRRTHSKSPPGPSSRKTANLNRSWSPDNRKLRASRSPLRRSPPRGSFTKRREERRSRSRTPDRVKSESDPVFSVEKSPDGIGSSSQEALLVCLPPKSKWELDERIAPPKNLNTEKTTDSYEESVVCKTESFSTSKLKTTVSRWDRNSSVYESTNEVKNKIQIPLDKIIEKRDRENSSRYEIKNQIQKSLEKILEMRDRNNSSMCAKQKESSPTSEGQNYRLFSERELKSEYEIRNVKYEKSLLHQRLRKVIIAPRPGVTSKSKSKPSSHLQHTHSSVESKEDGETKQVRDPSGLPDHSELADLNGAENKEDSGKRMTEEARGEVPDNRVPGDTDPLSDLYESEPTHIVHVKSPVQGFTGHVIKKSIGQHLFIENVSHDKIAVQFKNTCGSPFEFIEVTFMSLCEAKLWFQTTKRRITLQYTAEMKADYFLYYAGKSWHCKNCHNGHNIFFRSLCHYCYSHKNGSPSSFRISDAPTRFLGIGKLPYSIDESNVMRHLPEMMQKCHLKSVRIVADPNMNCCCGLVIVEMLNIEEAMITQSSCLSPGSRHFITYMEIDSECPDLPYSRVIRQDDVDGAPELLSVDAHDVKTKLESDVKQQDIKSNKNDTFDEIQPILESNVITAGEVSATRVPGDTCPFSDLYDSSPSHLVHVKSHAHGFERNVITKSILHHLSINNVEYEKISVIHKNNYGNPFEYVDVLFNTSNQAEEWFLKTNRKITLQANTVVKADYFLYYAGEGWKCTNCKVRNVFFRSLCHLCYCHKIGSFTSVRFSDAPTRFLGFCKLPYSTSESKFIQQYLRQYHQWNGQPFNFRSVRVIEDPGMNCCCGVVVVEMPNIEEAMQFKQLCGKNSSRFLRYVDTDSDGPDLHYLNVSCQNDVDGAQELSSSVDADDIRTKLISDVKQQDIKSDKNDTFDEVQPDGDVKQQDIKSNENDTSDEIQPILEKHVSTAGKVLATRVPGDTCPFSDLYDSNPSRLVHVKSPVHGYDEHVIKESILHHLSTNNVEHEKISVNRINDLGNPFEYIEVVFISSNQAEEWFLKTNRKIALQYVQAIKTDYFLYYAGECWECKNCGKVRNIFFRSLCHICYCHKSGFFTSVRFSDAPTRFLGFCKLPHSTNGSNFKRHLPQIRGNWQKCNFKSVRVIEDPGMNCCCGVVVVEMFHIDEARALHLIASQYPQLLTSSVNIRYIEQDCPDLHYLDVSCQDGVDGAQELSSVDAHDIKTKLDSDVKQQDIKSDKNDTSDEVQLDGDVKQLDIKTDKNDTSDKVQPDGDVKQLDIKSDKNDTSVKVQPDGDVKQQDIKSDKNDTSDEAQPDGDVKQQDIKSVKNDTCDEIQPILENHVSTAGKVSATRVPGDTCPFSDLYDCNPSRLVHVKSHTHGFKRNVIKESILHHLSTNDVEYVKISVNRINDLGNPFEYIEVVFKSSNQAEEWFLKTNRKITLQSVQAIKTDYFLYYAGECWECKNCGKVRNIFFRSLCHLCYCHKSGSFTSVRFSDAPTRFLGFCKLPHSTNESNFMQHLPQIQCNWQKCDFESVRVIKDPGMNCCCGVVIVEMTNVKEATHIQLIASQSPQLLTSCVNIRYIEQDCEKVSDTSAEIQLSLKKLVSTAENRSDNRIPGDTDPFSNLYMGNPSCLVHVKPSSIQHFTASVLKKSIQRHLSMKHIKCVKISVVKAHTLGNPFDYIEVKFESPSLAVKWFLKTNRKITLQCTRELKADYLLYYAGESWRCKSCDKGWNVFFRSLCHLCYCHKSGSFTSVRFSDAPTRFLGFCKLPHSTNESNFMQHLPQIQCNWQKCDFKSVRVIKDPAMNCCCGVVIVEMTNVKEATHIQLIASQSPQLLTSCVNIRYIEQDCEKVSDTSAEIQLSLKNLVSTAENRSDNRIPGDTDPFSNLYTGNPSCLVHVKPSSIQHFTASVLKKSIEQHLSMKHIKCVNISVVKAHTHGNPFDYIEVKFESPSLAAKWFLKTNCKITLQCTRELKADYFLYYAGELWCCKSCDKGWNAFFRSLCHRCYSHKSGLITPVKFSVAPTRFLGFCGLPYSINERNVMVHLPEIMQKCHLKSVCFVEDPAMNLCCGVVIVEFSSADEATGILQMSSIPPSQFLRYIDLDNSDVTHHRRVPGLCRRYGLCRLPSLMPSLLPRPGGMDMPSLLPRPVGMDIPSLLPTPGRMDMPSLLPTPGGTDIPSLLPRPGRMNPRFHQRHLNS